MFFRLTLALTCPSQNVEGAFDMACVKLHCDRETKSKSGLASQQNFCRPGQTSYVFAAPSLGDAKHAFYAGTVQYTRPSAAR